MDKHYTDLARKLSKSNRIGQSGKEYTSLINSTMCRFAFYLESEQLDFSKEIFSSWLIEEIPFPTADQFYDVACLMDKIVDKVDSNLVVNPLSHIEGKTSDYDKLPLWGQRLHDEYCFYLLLSGKYQMEKKHNTIHFITFLVDNGFEKRQIVDCKTISSYRLYWGRTVSGIRDFIDFLTSLGLATYYSLFAFNPFFTSRVPLFDEVSLGDCEDAFTIEEYREASEKLIQARKEAGYSVSALYDNTGALAEFGIFLEVHDRGFSLEAVNKFIEVDGQKVGIRIKIRRRTLLEINDILRGKSLQELPRFYAVEKKMLPEWSLQSVNAYKSMREKNHMTPSTLCMDYSSLMRFCNYLDSIEITSFSDVTQQHVKDFNLQDMHSTAEGKAAYNHRIRGFLRFLYEENVTEHDLSLSVAAVSAVKIKPPVILTEEEETKLNDYLDTTASLLDKALLKIASQTGMRSTDIVNLTFNSIDWDNRTFRIVQQKTGVETILPFSNGVGNALYEYITLERPETESDFIFITPKAPFVPYSRNVLTSALGRALGKRKGAHILRKTLASKMTASSLVFSTVTDALGHTTDVTLDPYISIDEKRLKECALPLGEMFAYKGGLM